LTLPAAYLMELCGEVPMATLGYTISTPPSAVGSQASRGLTIYCVI